MFDVCASILFVSEDTIKELEDLVLTKRQSYRTAGAFYRDFEGGNWLRSLTLPAKVESSAVRKVLKTKWLDEADFTRSYDHSNIVLMRLELVIDELTEADLDRLLDLPTRTRTATTSRQVCSSSWSLFRRSTRTRFHRRRRTGSRRSSPDERSPSCGTSAQASEIASCPERIQLY